MESKWESCVGMWFAPWVGSFCSNMTLFHCAKLRLEAACSNTSVFKLHSPTKHLFLQSNSPASRCHNVAKTYCSQLQHQAQKSASGIVAY